MITLEELLYTIYDDKVTILAFFKLFETNKDFKANCPSIVNNSISGLVWHIPQLISTICQGKWLNLKMLMRTIANYEYFIELQKNFAY